MRKITAFDPSLTTTGTFGTAQASAGSKVYLLNESYFGLELDLGPVGTCVLPAWYALLLPLKYTIASITWSVDYTLIMDTSSLPSSLVTGFSFDRTEDTSTYKSGPLVRQFAIGNTVGLGGGSIGGGGSQGGTGTVTTATAVQNDGNVTNTQFIESSVTGVTGSALSINNDGTATWKVLVSGSYQTVITVSNTGNKLKLSQTGANVEVVGGLAVDQNLSITGTSTFTGTVACSSAVTMNSTLTVAGQISGNNMVLTGGGNTLTTTGMTLTGTGTQVLNVNTGGVRTALGFYSANNWGYFCKTTGGTDNALIWLDNVNSTHVSTTLGTSIVFQDASNNQFFQANVGSVDLSIAANNLKLALNQGIIWAGSAAAGVSYDGGGNMVLNPSTVLGTTGTITLKDGAGNALFQVTHASGFFNPGIQFNSAITLPPASGVTWLNSGNNQSISRMKRGSAVITAATTVTVTHGMGATPQQVFVDINSSTTSVALRVTSIGATTFQIIAAAVGTYTVGWMAIA